MRIGVFVGGASSRMGSPKGLLLAPSEDGQTSETLVERALRVAIGAGLDPVLVGSAFPYAGIAPHVPRIADAPSGVGPMGGLRAILLSGDALVVACDMPYVERTHLQLLMAMESDAAIVAPRAGSRWQPFCARYRAEPVVEAIDALLASGSRSLQALYDRVSVEVADIDPAALRDWDCPEDVTR